MDVSEEDVTSEVAEDDEVTSEVADDEGSCSCSVEEDSESDDDELVGVNQMTKYEDGDRVFKGRN